MQIAQNSIEHLVTPSSEQTNSGKEPGVEATESRAHSRFFVQRSGALRIVKSPPAIMQLSEENPARKSAIARIKDLSRSGIGCFYPCQLFPKESIEIRLEQFLVNAQVVRCRKLASGDYEIGGVITGVHSMEKSPHPVAEPH